MGHAGGVRRKVCFVTGTRAEFGLMRTVLRRIARHPKLQLQIIATGMHLDRSRGYSISDIRKDGWTVDATVPWNSKGNLAVATASASAGIAKALDRLQSDIVLVVGDRVEAFAAASAGHLSQRIVAHVHGGDRAAGQVDDTLRHAITKLSHVHFAATRESADRIRKLGEDAFRVHLVGSPGIEGIREEAVSRAILNLRFQKLKWRRFALLVLHPVDPSGKTEAGNASRVLTAIRQAGIPQVVVIDPNNDPGSNEIARTWRQHQDEIDVLLPNVDRRTFLGLLRESAMLVGNSSSGIIEAASFGVGVVDVGPRQIGRERGANVVHCTYETAAITRAIHAIWRDGRVTRFLGKNLYGGGKTSEKVAKILASENLFSDRTRRKLIAY